MHRYFLSAVIGCVMVCWTAAQAANPVMSGAEPVSQKPFVYKKQNDSFTLFWPTTGSLNGEDQDGTQSPYERFGYTERS